MPICFIAKQEIKSWFLFGFLGKNAEYNFYKKKEF